MDEVHPCPAAVVDRLAAELAVAADGRLVAVYLHGSAVLGGWVPGRSDIDVLVVATDDVGETTLDSMAHAIVGTSRERLPDGCLPKLETSIVTAAAARDPAPPRSFLRHVVTDPSGAVRVVGPDPGGDRDLLMHYAAFRVAGYAAFGPPQRDVIGPVARAELLEYLANELVWGLANAPERYSVLNSCRALLYLTDGVIVSKIAGGETVLRRRTGPADVITRALAQQRGTQEDLPPAADAVAFVEETAALLRRGV